MTCRTTGVKRIIPSEYDWRTTTRVILYDEFNRVIEIKYYPKGTTPKISALYKMFPGADRMDIR